MGMPAIKFEEENFVEERVARLEANVEHLQSDVTEIKSDMKEMRKDIRRLDDKIDGVKDSVTALRVETKDSIASLTLAMEKGFSKLSHQMIWLYVGLGSGLLAVIARGFGWV